MIFLYREMVNKWINGIPYFSLEKNVWLFFKEKSIYFSLKKNDLSLKKNDFSLKRSSE